MYCTSDNQVSKLIEEGVKLDRYLYARQIPQEQKDVYLAKKDIEKDILRREGVRHVSELGMYLIQVMIFMYIANSN